MKNTGLDSNAGGLSSVRVTNTKKLIQERYSTLSNMAKAIDKSVSYLSHLLAGNRPYSEKVAREVEKTLGLEPFVLDQTDESNYISLPTYNNSFIKRIVCKESISNFKAADLKIILSNDDSMETSIGFNQGIVFNTTHHELNNNLIYVIEINKNILIRRVFKDLLNNKVILKADNKIYGDMSVDVNQIKILGLAVLALEKSLI